MNERMIELVIQARNYALDQKRHYERVHNTEQCLEEYREVYNEKFAELIVAECMRMCDVAAIGYDSHGHTKEGNGCAMAREYIKEHFGVEE